MVLNCEQASFHVKARSESVSLQNKDNYYFRALYGSRHVQLRLAPCQQLHTAEDMCLADKRCANIILLMQRHKV